MERNVLDGFDLETKLRKTIYDLLQPIGTKQSEVERRVIQMQTQLIDAHENRLGDLEFALFKSHA
jgi:hypothetical protein